MKINHQECSKSEIKGILGKERSHRFKSTSNFNFLYFLVASICLKLDIETIVTCPQKLELELAKL